MPPKTKKSKQQLKAEKKLAVQRQTELLNGRKRILDAAHNFPGQRAVNALLRAPLTQQIARRPSGTLCAFPQVSAQRAGPGHFVCAHSADGRRRFDDVLRLAQAKYVPTVRVWRSGMRAALLLAAAEQI